MKAVILAGGLGTRISEETHLKPKPMITIGGKPILWHIMRIYSHYGINDFVICLGYKGYQIKEYFSNYYRHMSDLTIDIRNNHTTFHKNFAEPWRVTLVDTGNDTMTGGRLKRVREYLDEDEAFLMTYGDGLANVDINALIQFHNAHGKLATLTAVQPLGRFGVLDIGDDSIVKKFKEKPTSETSYINGGFFVLSPKTLDYIESDATPWEAEPLESLAREKQLVAYHHEGFWQCMDTLRDKQKLETLYQQQDCPWTIWNSTNTSPESPFSLQDTQVLRARG